MPEITSYYSLACALTSIPGFQHERGSTALCAQIALQLQSAVPEEKPVLAQILAELLQKHAYEDIKLSENILSAYVQGLVATAETDAFNEELHSNLRLAVKLSISRPGILRRRIDEAEDSICHLISAASKVHVSSDDAFETNTQHFLVHHCSAIQECVAREPPDDIPKLHQRTATHLRFLKALLLAGNDLQSSAIASRLSEQLPATLLALIGLRNSYISELACQVFRLLLKVIDRVIQDDGLEVLWDGVRFLLRSPSHTDLSFSIWLNWVSMHNAPPQPILEREEYWSLLQTGLATGFSERRKFALHVLMTSLRLITAPISNRLLTYNPARRKQLENSWCKYSTLIEIISLSASTNQLKAAVPEIKRFFGPCSDISPSWVVVLMRLGLQATSAPLQKVVWELLLNLNSSEVEFLVGEKEGTDFITDVFLPYAVTAHHFVVRQTSPKICEHGKALATFLQKVVQVVDNASAVLSFLYKKEDTIFAPARVYVLKGLLDGVVDRNIWGAKEFEEIVGVARMHRFTKMKTDLCIVMCLHLLLSAREDIDVDRVIDTVVDIIAGKEYLLSQTYSKVLYKYILRRTQGPDNTVRFLCQKLLKSITTLKGSANPPAKAVLLPFVILHIRDDSNFVMHDERIKTVKNVIQILRSCHIKVRINFAFLLRNQAIASAPDVASIIEDIAQEMLGYECQDKPLYLFCAELYEFSILLENLVAGPQEIKRLKIICKYIAVKYSKFGDWRGKQKDFDLKREETMANLMANWAACLRFRDDETWEGSIGLNELLGMIRNFPLPVLGQNKHDNVEALRITNVFLRSAVKMVGCQLNREKITLEYLSGFFDTLLNLLRYVDSETLLDVFACSKEIFTRAAEIISEIPNLETLVEELWNVVNAAKHSADPTSIYVAFIKTAFHVIILKTSLKRDLLAKLLSGIAQDIMRLSTGRRSIGPAFACVLRDAYSSNADIFCSCDWVDIVLRRFIDAMPNRDLDFVNEMPLANLFDEMEQGGVGGKDHYTEYHGEEEIFAQAYVFFILSRLDPNRSAEKRLALDLREKIFAPWMKNKPGMPIYSKWKKTSQLQALLILERFLSAEEASGFLEKIIETLRNEPHPRYRFLFEWIISMCILRFREHHNVLWKHIQGFEKPNPKLQASLLRVALMVARELKGNMREKHYSELVYTVVPLTSNNKVNIRHQAISMVLELWDDVVSFKYTTLTDNPLLQRVRQSILNSPYYKEFGTEKDVRTFDARGNYSMAGIFAGGYLATKGDEIEVGIVNLDIFRKLERNLSSNHKRISFVPLGNSENETATVGKVEYTKSEEAAIIEAPLQTKSGTWDAKTFTSTLDHSERTDSTGPDIIVIASLIENAYNLGGLSRVSEIMGVKTLCIYSKDVLKSNDFTSVSVNSEVWLPITELQVPDIPVFIRTKRAEGYKAVGIEQTDRSIILGDESFRFARKTVLLLGSEKYGIPAGLLAELDMCVEIPQIGETRSMNVQTAAAVVLFECCRQFR